MHRLWVRPRSTRFKASLQRGGNWDFLVRCEALRFSILLSEAKLISAALGRRKPINGRSRNSARVPCCPLPPWDSGEGDPCEERLEACERLAGEQQVRCDQNVMHHKIDSQTTPRCSLVLSSLKPRCTTQCINKYSTPLYSPSLTPRLGMVAPAGLSARRPNMTLWAIGYEDHQLPASCCLQSTSPAFR